MIAARPNEGELLLSGADNEALQVAPRELQLLFRGGAGIDGSSSNLTQGIRITRQGTDHAFDYAYAETDFNTAGAVVVKFEATKLGLAEEGITITFTKSDHGNGDRRPQIKVLGKTISVDLNSQTGAETTARVLVDALNAHPAASRKIHATVTGNTARPLTTNLAQAASVTSDLNTVTNPGTGNTAELEFTAVTAGTAGNAIQIVVTKSDHNNQSMAPTINVSGTTITVDLNEELGYHTRAQQVADAINQHPLAKTLVQARVKSGNLLADVAAPAINYSPLLLSGGDDGNGNPVPLAPLVLSGAGRAEATSEFRRGGAGSPAARRHARTGGRRHPSHGVGRRSGREQSAQRKGQQQQDHGYPEHQRDHPARDRPRSGQRDQRQRGRRGAVAGFDSAGQPRGDNRGGRAHHLGDGGGRRGDYAGLPGAGGYRQRSHRAVCRDAAGRRLSPGSLRRGLRESRHSCLAERRGLPLTPQVEGTDRDVIDFELNLAPQIVSVVPQPVTRKIQARLTRLPPDGDFRLIFHGEYTRKLNVYNVTAQKSRTPWKRCRR